MTDKKKTVGTGLFAGALSPNDPEIEKRRVAHEKQQEQAREEYEKKQKQMQAEHLAELRARFPVPDNLWGQSEEQWLYDQERREALAAKVEEAKAEEERLAAEDAERTRLVTPLGNVFDSAALDQQAPLTWLDFSGRHIIRDPSIALVYGRPGVMKSFAAIDWAWAFGTGHPSFGDGEPHPVLYIAAEGAASIGLRKAAWLKHHGVTDEAARNVHVLGNAINLTDFGGQTPNGEVGWKGEAQALWQTVEEKGYRLVVIDTLNRSIGGKTEGDSTFGSVVAAAQGIVDRGAIALIVHHADKSDRTVRGHSALEGAVDSVLHVSRPSAKVVRFKVEKLKDAEGGWAFEMEPVTVADVKDGESSVVLVTPDREEPDAITNRDGKVLRVFMKSETDSLRFTDIQKDAGLAKATLNRALESLLADGTLSKLDDGSYARNIEVG